MSDFKDVFISYGRKESLCFAQKLYAKLQANGYSAWFDHVNIPKGDDFQQQIDNGIESAHNFIYLIAPHANASEYCRKEIELALRLGKRVIPILHIEHELDTLHTALSKINWIYAREQACELPLEEWTAIDDFDAAFDELARLLEKEKAHVQLHTQLLNKALTWHNRQRSDEGLLVGKARTEAEAWLLREFVVPEQPPCMATELLCDFICASKKNAENLMTDVFLSHAAADKETRRKLAFALSSRLVTTWVHEQDIQKGGDFEQAIFEGIEQASNVVFLVSKAALASDWCTKELEYAQQLNKRIIPLSIEPIDAIELPETIKSLQFIDLADNQNYADFNADMDQLLQTLATDKNYFFRHKSLLVQALKWKRQEKNDSMLLHGYNLQNAEAWLSIGLKRSAFRPLPLHEEFIEQSTARAGKLSIEVFVSYSRNDGDFARRLNSELQVTGKTTWFDQDNIVESSDFQQEIYRGIEQSENFLFLVSSRSVQSPYCSDEVEYARKQGKRMLTVLVEEVLPSELPPALATIQWIDARNDFSVAFAQLIRALNTDRVHVRQHNELQNAALEWEHKAQTTDLLLRGVALNEAKLWLEKANTNKTKPFPTDLQKAYIGNSELLQKEERQREKRRRGFYVGGVVVSLALVVCVAMLIYALHMLEEARVQKLSAQARERLARLSERQAKEARSQADSARFRVEKARQQADSLMFLARDKAEFEATKRKEANLLLSRKMSKTQQQRHRLKSRLAVLGEKLTKGALEKGETLDGLKKEILQLEDSLDMLSKIISPYTLNQGWMELESAGFIAIDAAICWPTNRNKLYFFYKNEYIRWDVRLNKMDGGYPRKIKNNWPGLNFDRIDAAFVLHHERKAYFFRGNQFVRYDLNNDHADPGYPKTIDAQNWPGLPFGSIDAAVSWEPIGGKIYLMSGNQYVRINPQTHAMDNGYPAQMSQDLWNGLTFKRLDAALFWNKDISYFFSGNEYQRWDNLSDRGY